MIFGGFVGVNMEVASTSPVTRSMLPRILDTEEVDIADTPLSEPSKSMVTSLIPVILTG